MSKKATGVHLDKDIIQALDSIKNDCIDLGATRSEIINTVLKMYFNANNKDSEKIAHIRKSLIKIRKGKF